MIPGFGKEQISIGSAPDNDVVLQGPGVAPRHARIVKQGGAARLPRRRRGTLAGERRARGAEPARPVRLPHAVRGRAGVPVPLSHPAIVMMVMARGSVSRAAGASRDRARGRERLARHRELRGEREPRDGDDGPHDGPGRRLDQRHVRRRASASRRISPCRSTRTASSRSVPSRFRSRCSVSSRRRSRARAIAPAGAACARYERRDAGTPRHGHARRRGGVRRAPQAPHGHRRAEARSAPGRGHHDRPHAGQRDRRPAPAG